MQVSRCLFEAEFQRAMNFHQTNQHYDPDYTDPKEKKKQIHLDFIKITQFAFPVEHFSMENLIGTKSWKMAQNDWTVKCTIAYEWLERIV